MLLLQLWLRGLRLVLHRELQYVLVGLWWEVLFLLRLRTGRSRLALEGGQTHGGFAEACNES
jgi:hypothetical protein